MKAETDVMEQLVEAEGGIRVRMLCSEGPGGT